MENTVVDWRRKWQPTPVFFLVSLSISVFSDVLLVT